jgi:Na+-translocating ferredoxin:NAD+ oxidoreductase RnfD subunit
MKAFRSTSSVAILLGLIGLIAVRGVTSGVPAGMVVVFFVLFGVLKLVMGMKTWWHAVLGGAVASILMTEGGVSFV